MEPSFTGPNKGTPEWPNGFLSDCIFYLHGLIYFYHLQSVCRCRGKELFKRTVFLKNVSNHP